MDSNDIIIDLKGICRSYKLYDNKSDRLREALNPLKKSYHRNFVALSNINLQVRKGEVLGIIGRNGSGKSTLLKIIAGILPPSSGELIVNGHIVPLIELGAGFNPDFTGLENIYFYNSIHGFGKEETDAMLDEILDFAEIGDFIRQPLKVYSSGMRARLAFAVSINIRPDVLILDEILSVGDELFRRKCFAKMEEFFHGGKTVLYVSHSSASINELCSRCIWISDGHLVLDGSPKLVTTMYNKFLQTEPSKMESFLGDVWRLNHNTSLKQEIIAEISESGTIQGLKKLSSSIVLGNIRIDDILDQREYFAPDMMSNSTVIVQNYGVSIPDSGLYTKTGEKVNVIHTGCEYICRYKVSFKENLENVVFRIQFRNEKGMYLSGLNTKKTQMVTEQVNAGDELVISWKFSCNLLESLYYINIAVLTIVDGELIPAVSVSDALVFKVMARDSVKEGFFVWMDISPEINPEQ